MGHTMSTPNASARYTALVGAAALALTACGGDGDGDNSNGDDGNGGGEDSDGPMVTIGSAEDNFQIMCIQDPDNLEGLIISAIGADVDSIDGQFGFPERGDRLGVEMDDVYWEVSDSMGEFTSLEVDAENSYASGDAIFESPDDGSTEEGSFTFDCS